MPKKKIDEKDLELQDSEDAKMAPIEILDVEDGFNPRRDLQLDEEFLESVRVHGILSPLLIRTNPNIAGHYYVTDGHRRLEAARQAGNIKEVPVLVYYGEEDADLGPAEALLQAIVANKHTDLTIEEKASAYMRFKELQPDTEEEEIAELLGIGVRTLKETIRVLNSNDEELKKAVSSEDPSERIPTRVAARAADLPDEEREEVVKELKGKGMREGLETVQNAEAKIGKVNRGREPESRIGFPWTADAKKRARILYDCVWDTLSKNKDDEAAQRHLEAIWVISGEREVADLYPGGGSTPNQIIHSKDAQAFVEEKAPKKTAPAKKGSTEDKEDEPKVRDSKGRVVRKKKITTKKKVS